MAADFTKVYRGFFKGSLADQPPFARLLFLAMLSEADENGIALGTPSFWAGYVRISVEDVEKGLEILSSPDPDSTSTDDDGRRIVPWGEGANRWKIVNYRLYYERNRSEERRAYQAETMRGRREIVTVYFIEATESKRIKIGWTTLQMKLTKGDTAKSRLSQLQIESPEPLAVLASCHPSTIEVERALHKHFSAARVQGEWFAPTAELLHLIRHLRENPKDAKNGNSIRALLASVSASYDVSPERENERESERKGSKVRPSSVEEVAEYMREIDVRYPMEEAEKFWDHFQSNGWKIGGKAAMKDWKATVRNWVRRDKPEGGQKYDRV